MANDDNPCGFKPMNNVGLRPPTRYRIEGSEGTPYATALYVGSPVNLSGGYVIIATAGTDNPLLGFISHFENRDSGFKDSGGHYPASSGDDWYVYVWDDPHTRFIAQDDGVGTAMDLLDIGKTGNLLIGTGSTTTNLAGSELDGSTFSGTGQAVTDQLRLIDIVDRVGNAVGINAEWVVEIHNHALRQESNVDATT